MMYLQFVLKEFNNIATPTDDLLIWYFRDGMRPSIHVQLDKNDHKLDYWQVVVKQIIDVEAKGARQTPSLTQKNNVRYSYN